MPFRGCCTPGRNDVAVAVAEPPARLPARVLEQLEPRLALVKRRGLRPRGLYVRPGLPGALLGGDEFASNRLQLLAGRFELGARLVALRRRRSRLGLHPLVVLVDGVRQ